MLKSKKYLVPLAFLNPELTGGIAFLYITEGRFHPNRDAGVFDITREIQPQPSRAVPTAIEIPALPLKPPQPPN